MISRLFKPFNPRSTRFLIEGEATNISSFSQVEIASSNFSLIPGLSARLEAAAQSSRRKTLSLPLNEERLVKKKSQNSIPLFIFFKKWFRVHRSILLKTAITTLSLLYS